MGELVARTYDKRVKGVFPVVKKIGPFLAILFFLVLGRFRRLLLGFLRLDEEVDLDIVLLGDLADNITQCLSVVLPDPITMKFTGNLNDHLHTIEGNKPGLSEPGVVTLTGHFAFYQEKYLFPNLCQIHTLPQKIVLVTNMLIHTC